MNNVIDNLLEPLDRRRAWWRDYEPLPYPEPIPADWEQIKATVEKATKNSYFANDLNWHKIDMNIRMSRQEAHFWLTLMLDLDLILRDVSYDPQDYDGNLNLDMVRKGFTGVEQYQVPSSIVIPLHVLFDVRDYLPFVIDFTYTHYAEDWAEAWLPCVTEAELEVVRELVHPRLIKTVPTYKIPAQNSSYSNYVPAIVRWGINCGMGKDIYPLVEKCDDDYFADRFGRMRLLKGNYYADVFLALPTAEQVVHEIRRVKLVLCEPYQVRWWLAHTGTDHLDYIRDSIMVEKGKIRARRLMTILGSIETLEVAGYMFEFMSKNIDPNYAQKWLQDHPRLTVEALIPFAKKQGKQADLARNHLRLLIREGKDDLVSEFADDDLMGKLIDRTVEVSAPVFDDKTTPQWLQDAIHNAKQGKLTPAPNWVSYEVLPPLVIEGHQLSEKQGKLFLRALKSSTRNELNPLVSAIVDHADRHLLDNLLWGLIEQWKLDGERRQEAWAFYAAIRLGTNKLLPQITPIIKEMVTRKKARKVIKQIVADTLQELGYNASDTAFMQLEALRPTFHAKRKTGLIDDAIEVLAWRRKLSIEALQDRAVPDCGLDENGTRVFDYGERQFTAVIGNNLKPMVRDDKGKIRKQLPKPGKRDDIALAEPAYESWKFIKKQIRDTVKAQTPRLEQAMIFERRWMMEHFMQVFVQHPTMRHLARQLVWGVYRDNQLTCSFRMTEDSHFVDYADKPLNLTLDSYIGIVHPIHLDSETLQHWGDTLIDYEIMPLFPQLGRSIHQLTPAMLEAGQLNPRDFTEEQLHIMAVRTAMFKAGYAEPRWGSGYSKRYPQYDITVVVKLNSVRYGWARFETAQEVESVEFVKGDLPQSYGFKYDSIPISDVPPVVLSEAIYDIQTNIH